MHHVIDFVLSLLFDLLLYPVRDRHPLVVLAYAVALTIGSILVCALIASAVPDPFR